MRPPVLRVGWFALGYDALERLATKHPYLTTDDLWDELGDNLPRDPNQVGRLVQSALTEGLIEHSGMTVQTRGPKGRGRRIAVLRSRIYEGPKVGVDEWLRESEPPLAQGSLL